MEGEKKRSSWALAGVVAVPVALLLAAYIGAYFAMVDWIYFDGERAPFYSTPFNVPYEAVDRFFRPMHAVDRNWLRHRMWHESPPGVNDPAPSDNPPETSN